MNGRLARVRERREALVARAAAQRADVARLAGACLAPVGVAGVALTAWRFLRRRPVITALSVAAVVVLRPSRALQWGLRLWPVVALARRVFGSRSRS